MIFDLKITYLSIMAARTCTRLKHGVSEAGLDLTYQPKQSSLIWNHLCFGPLLLFLLLLSLALGEEHRGCLALLFVLLPHVVKDLGDDGHVLAAVIQCACGNRIAIRLEGYMTRNIFK